MGNRVARERKGRGGGEVGARGRGRKCEEQGEERKGDESARREGRERESGTYFKQCFLKLANVRCHVVLLTRNFKGKY